MGENCPGNDEESEDCVVQRCIPGSEFIYCQDFLTRQTGFINFGVTRKDRIETWGVRGLNWETPIVFADRGLGLSGHGPYLNPVLNPDRLL